MCGIYCSISLAKPLNVSEQTQRLLKDRGPDHYGCIHHTLTLSGKTIFMTFAASVLSLRRDADDLPIPQPHVGSESDNILCWNGEAWQYDELPIDGSDTNFVAAKLQQSQKQIPRRQSGILKTLSKFAGPYAMMYLDEPDGKIFFGRDCVGRRSLLWTVTQDGAFILSSVADRTISDSWSEVDANNMSIMDLSKVHEASIFDAITRVPWTIQNEGDAFSLPLPWPAMNTMLPTTSTKNPNLRLHCDSSCVQSLHTTLLGSLQLRLSRSLGKDATSAAILFSGGLDCTLITRLAHACLPPQTRLDLINVAFENPRIHKATEGVAAAYELCPDRITARQSYAELQVCCSDRDFNLVCVNIPYIESVKYKDEIKALIYPHDTEMDISIAMALFFAARGSLDNKVLFSGLGADELFGGYQRHALAYQRGGYSALLDELQLDTDRLGKRNLGRDDRVISRWGKEARYPFLDESVIGWALSAPVWEKVGFGFSKQTEAAISADVNVDLDDKLVLRCLAKKLGLANVACEKKRAIQFGSRSAKMESGRTKGTQKIA